MKESHPDIVNCNLICRSASGRGYIQQDAQEAMLYILCTLNKGLVFAREAEPEIEDILPAIGLEWRNYCMAHGRPIVDILFTKMTDTRRGLECGHVCT
jgi:hypothetical protein